MYAYSGILTALYERERTGAGSTLDVAMIDALGEWMMQPDLPRRLRRQAASRAPAPGTRRSRPTARTRPRTAPVYLGVQNDREWATLCRDVLERPELVDDPRFARNPSGSSTTTS